MLNLIIGLLIGLLAMYLAITIGSGVETKKGSKAKQYNNLPFTTRIRDSVRHIIFEYNIKRKNNDFLFNMLLDNKVVLQLMHRAHFPELCQAESDIEFGLALYIPVSDLSESMIHTLDQIIEEESEVIRESKTGGLRYYVIDLGKRVRYSGYILSRIISEVFSGEENQYSSELFSEGNLPYHLN